MHDKNLKVSKYRFASDEVRAIRETMAKRTPHSAIPFEQFKKAMKVFIEDGKGRYATSLKGAKN